MGGTGQGMGLRPKALVYPLGAPGPLWPSLGSGDGVSGERVLSEGWVGPAPSRLILLAQTVAPGGSPPDHPQRPEHPSAQARALLPQVQEELAGFCCPRGGPGAAAEAGWTMVVLCDDAALHVEHAAGSTWSWWLDLSPTQALERRPTQCAGKMLGLEGVWVGLGGHGGSGQLCGQSQTLGCSPCPVAQPTLPAPCSDAPCRAEGAEGSPALQGGSVTSYC